MKIIIISVLLISFLTSCGGSTSNSERWMAIYNGRGHGLNYQLGVAYANNLDGKWESNNSKPILAAPYGYDQLVKPSVGKVGQVFYLYVQAMNFYGLNATNRPDIFLYTSDDGINWILKSKNPVLQGGSRPAFLFDPSDSGNEFKLWYRAHGATDISYASSSDGVDWVLHGTVLTNGPPGAFDSKNASPGVVVKVDKIFHLFYEAADDELFFNAGEASFSDPRGVYNKNQKNPVLRRESNAESSLTSNAIAGEYLINVENANAFKIDQPLIIFDEAARWELIRVVEIINNKKIRLASPLLQNYNIASTATIRSWAFSKIYISDIKFKNGIWYVYATAFDPYKGIASGPLELTGFASGPDLNSLKWDYSRSPLFPINSNLDSSWNGHARENPTIFKIYP
jgi:hypothetical protein